MDAMKHRKYVILRCGSESELPLFHEKFLILVATKAAFSLNLNEMVKSFVINVVCVLYIEYYFCIVRLQYQFVNNASLGICCKIFELYRKVPSSWYKF